MSITQITGGIVSVEDGTKSAVEYEPPRKVRVELHFGVAEGDADVAATILQDAGTLAARQVDRLLGRVKTDAPAEAAPAAEPQRRTRRTRAEIEADEAAAKAAAGNSPATSSGSPASPADAGNGAGAPPTGDAGAPQTSADPAGPATPPPSAPADEGDEWDTGAKPADVSDKELNDACSAAADRCKNPSLVRDVIASFNPKPAGEKFKVTEIPQGEQRHAFLAKLADLKA